MTMSEQRSLEAVEGGWYYTSRATGRRAFVAGVEVQRARAKYSLSDLRRSLRAVETTVSAIAIGKLAGTYPAPEPEPREPRRYWGANQGRAGP